MHALALGSILFVMLTTIGCATGVEGTYVLTSRQLPDGSTVRPPAIQGCLTMQDGTRNFNVYWVEPSGNAVSLASIAHYGLTDAEYWERNVYHMASGFGAGVQYDLSSQRASSPVTRGDGQTGFQLPLHDEPYVVFTPDGFTATVEGVFVDHWSRIR